jgi:hypothetical protein
MLQKDEEEGCADPDHPPSVQQLVNRAIAVRNGLITSLKDIEAMISHLQDRNREISQEGSSYNLPNSWITDSIIGTYHVEDVTSRLLAER